MFSEPGTSAQICLFFFAFFCEGFCHFAKFGFFGRQFSHGVENTIRNSGFRHSGPKEKTKCQVSSVSVRKDEMSSSFLTLSLRPSFLPFRRFSWQTISKAGFPTFTKKRKKKRRTIRRRQEGGRERMNNCWVTRLSPGVCPARRTQKEKQKETWQIGKKSAHSEKGTRKWWRWAASEEEKEEDNHPGSRGRWRISRRRRKRWWRQSKNHPHTPPPPPPKRN